MHQQGVARRQAFRRQIAWYRVARPTACDLMIPRAPTQLSQRYSAAFVDVILGRFAEVDDI